MAEKTPETISELIDDVGPLRSTALTVDAADALLQQMADENKKLLTEAREAHQQATNAMSTLDVLQAKQHLAKLERLASEEHENSETIKQLLDDRQASFLKERLVERMGSLQRWALKETGIILLILLVLGLLIYEMSMDDLAVETVTTFFYIDTACCVIFLLNFFWELHLAENKRWYWRTHWIDFVTSIPIPPGTIFHYGRWGRSLRLVRIIRVLRLLRLLRFAVMLWRGMESLSGLLDVRLMKKSFLLGVLSILFGAYLIQVAESSDVEAVNNMSGSAWWSFTTVVTGGFGDIHNPESPLGKFTTVILVIVGMVLVGIFTATLTSLLVKDEGEETE
ncbi:MAG: ion transporter, partial [Myxococcota bacterium]|nr:ion transporter [Myxococcota bacterium]